MEFWSPSRIRNVVAAIAFLSLVIGVWARIQHLERKIFWPDEVLTAVRVSGHTLTDFRATFDDRLHPYADVARYQIRDPKTGAADVVRALAAEEPQHPPLFYVLDRFAVDLLGSSIAGYRSVSVLAGLVAIGCAFALGSVAYGTIGGFVLGALVAVSPFHVHLSRQAREYELFSTVALGASALFLHALNRPNASRWAAYGVVTALGLYTDPLFAGVIAAHAIALVAARRTKAAVAGFGIACLAALVAFAPWVGVMIRGHEAAHAQLGWLAGTYPLKFLIEKWSFNLGTVGFDAELRDPRLAFFVGLFLVLVAFAVVRGLRAARADAAAALGLAFVVIPLALFGGYDIVAGAHYTTVARYFAETALGCELLVAGAIVACFTGSGHRAAVGVAIFAATIVAGSASDIASANALNWWDNNTQINYRSLAAAIDERGSSPTIVVSEPSAALVLSHYLGNGAAFLLVSDPARSLANLPSASAPVFLVAPSAELRSATASAGWLLTDVSPANESPMADFRSRLDRERPSIGAALGPDSAANALWTAQRARGEASPAPASK